MCGFGLRKFKPAFNTKKLKQDKFVITIRGVSEYKLSAAFIRKPVWQWLLPRVIF